MEPLRIEVRAENPQSAKKSQEQKRKFVGSAIPQKGHTLFCINLLTGYVEKAEFEKEPAVRIDALGKNEVLRKRVVIKPDCYYVSALNARNAVKRLLRKTAHLMSEK